MTHYNAANFLLGLFAMPIGTAVTGAPSADAEPQKPEIAPNPAAQSVCRCGSTAYLDSPIHGGQSIRRDCARCDRFIGFPIWYGNDTGLNGQHLA